jgi:hypothetical protein
VLRVAVSDARSRNVESVEKRNRRSGALFDDLQDREEGRSLDVVIPSECRGTCLLTCAFARALKIVCSRFARGLVPTCCTDEAAGRHYHGVRRVMSWLEQRAVAGIARRTLTRNRFAS